MRRATLAELVRSRSMFEYGMYQVGRYAGKVVGELILVYVRTIEVSRAACKNELKRKKKRTAEVSFSFFFYCIWYTCGHVFILSSFSIYEVYLAYRRVFLYYVVIRFIRCTLHACMLFLLFCTRTCFFFFKVWYYQVYLVDTRFVFGSIFFDLLSDVLGRQACFFSIFSSSSGGEEVSPS